MFVAQKALNGQNLATSFFQRVMEREWSGLVEEEAQVGTNRELTAYGVPLYQVTPFKYMG